MKDSRWNGDGCTFAARAEMIDRHRRMTVEERLDLFERLSRDAAWVRSFRRIR